MQVTAMLLALVLAVPPLAGAQPAPTFRTTTRLIVQPVAARDKNGRPLAGLTVKDFTLTEDGEVQPIAFVQYQPLDGSSVDGVTPRLAPAASVSPGMVSIPLPGDSRYRGRRLVVLYFDLYGMPFFDQIRTFESAAAYVGGRMSPADLVAIMVFQNGAVRLTQDFTGDRETLRRSIQTLSASAEDSSRNMVTFDSGGGFGEDDDGFNVFATDRQLLALQTAATDLAPLPELKTLIYLGSGLRLNGYENQAQLRATINAAVRANVTINPIDARGLVAAAPLGDATRPSPGGIGMFAATLAQAAITRGQQAQDTLYALAKDTGGRAMFDNNDLSLGIVAAAQAVTGYYLVGYYSSHAASDGRFRRVKVMIVPPLSAELSYRPGYYGDKPYAKYSRADKERQLADALRLEDPVTEIPMAIAVHYFRLNRAEYFVPVSVRMAGAELTARTTGRPSRVAVDMIGEIKDEHGVTNRNVRDRVEIPAAGGSIQYETGFTILPGTYVIKLLARNENTGRIGTFQSSFTVPDLDRGETGLPISSVVLSGQRVAPGDVLYTVRQKISADTENPLVHDGQKLIPSVTRSFSAREPLFVFLQAYEQGSGAMRPLVAFVSVFRNTTLVLETRPLVVESGWDPVSRAVPVRFDLPLTALTPGRYDCQVTVLDPDGGRAAFWRTAIAITP